jgi:CBS domain-containing protein
VISRYYADLRQFAELRNVIVHERRGNRVIAEPTDETVAEFRIIAAALTNPPRLLPQFTRDVRTREAREPVGLAVADMRAASFSQIPITRDGEVRALLTSETVVRWLASQLEIGLVSISETPIAVVFFHTKEDDEIYAVAGKISLHDALSLFEEYATHGKTLDALVIAPGGRRDRAPAGILTVYDVPEVLKSLGLRRLSAASPRTFGVNSLSSISRATGYNARGATAGRAEAEGQVRTLCRLPPSTLRAIPRSGIQGHVHRI